jgi:hypothetical protein
MTRSPRACAASTSATSALVAAEQRVDVVEGRGVVAVVALRREARRQVQHRRPQLDEVVEVLRDARQVAAEHLGAGQRPGVRHLVVPAGGDRPARQLALVGLRRPREAVREDLVHDGVGHPLRDCGLGDQPEVGGVGDVADVPALGVQPGVRADDGARQQEAVARHRVDDPHRRRPPGGVRVGALDLGGAPRRLAVGEHPRRHGRGTRRAVGVVRDPHPDGDDVTERGRGVRDVQRRAVVMGLEEQVRGGRPAHPLTPPAVSPPTM